MCAVNEEREVGCGGTRGEVRVWEKVRDWYVGLLKEKSGLRHLLVLWV